MTASGQHQIALRRVRAAAWIATLEALAFGVFGVLQLFVIDNAHPSVAITNAAFFVLYSVGLGLTARGLRRQKSWTRGPVVLAQLIQLGVAWSFHGNGFTWLAVLLAIPAVAVIYVMFSPSTTGLLYGDRGGEGEDDDAGRTA